MSLLDWGNDKDFDLKALRLCTTEELKDENNPLRKCLCSISNRTSPACIIDPDTGTLVAHNGWRSENDDRYNRGRISVGSPSCYATENELDKAIQDGLITDAVCSEFMAYKRTNMLSPENFFRNINIQQNFLISLVGGDAVIKDININKQCDFVTTSRCNIHRIESLSRSLKFDNVHINANKNHLQSLYLYGNNIDVSGLYSNFYHLRYACGITEFPAKLFNIFDPDYRCEVYDRDKKQTVYLPIKNWRKIISVTNNNARYTLITPVSRIKKGIKLSDVFPTENFPELETLVLEGSNVNVVFTKKPHHSIASGIVRLPKRIDDTEIEHGNCDTMFEKTEDGWYVMFVKH